MARYLMTHSLLSSWLYMMKDNPYEDATTERDPAAEFMASLRREPTPTTEAMQNGIDFEDLVTSIVDGEGDTESSWYSAAAKVADRVRGGVLQYKAKREIAVSGMTFLLYGRLDALRAGTVYDIKFSKGYERGKYLNSTQHPTYLHLIPDAERFVYLVSNGSEVWEEEYRRDETPDIVPIIEDFVNFLSENDLMDTYKEHWGADKENGAAR